MQQPIVHLEQLKRALNCSTSLAINGQGLQSFIRGNANPTPAEKRFIAHEQGLILTLALADGESKPDIVQKLLQEPDNLVLAVHTLGGGMLLLRKLVVTCTDSLGITIKYHFKDGLPTLYFDQVPELQELNDSNVNWWIERKLETIKDIDAVKDQICHVLEKRGFNQVVFCDCRRVQGDLCQRGQDQALAAQVARRSWPPHHKALQQFASIHCRARQSVCAVWICRDLFGMSAPVGNKTVCL